MLGACDIGPVNYDEFERRTIEANLSVMDSAAAIYHARFAAGDIDAACAEAQAFLLTQEGVDTAQVAPDSTVWAFFSSGLLAGTGDISRDTADYDTVARAQTPSVRAAGGGEVQDGATYVLPFDAELPGTRRASDAIRGILSRKLNWESYDRFRGSEVDLGLALGEFNPGSDVLFWSGHGTTVPIEPGVGVEVAGLVLGKTYSKRSMAEAAVTQLAGYLNPGPDQVRQAAVVRFEGTPKYSIVILPGFIRVNANFDTAEPLPLNQTKTIVYLSCCYSAYAAFSTPALVQAFLDAGADIVCGYTWAVGDEWSCGKDTMFFSAMADSCFPGEARSAMGSLVDPKPRRGGQAEFRVYGDSMVLLRAVCNATRSGELLKAAAVQATRGNTGSHVNALLCPEGSTDVAATVNIYFPSGQPGEFNCSSDEGAIIYWMDVARERTYMVMKDFVGVSGTISVDRCRSDAITGHFSGTLGWWAPGRNPGAEPPSDAITVENGMFRFTGKVRAVGLN